MAPRYRESSLRTHVTSAVVAGVVLVVVVAAAYLVGPTASSPAAAPPAGSSAGSGVASSGAAAERPANPAPHRLADQPAVERYFNATSAKPGNPTVVIRPELDERRQGYVVYALAGQYRTLSTVARLADGAAAGANQRFEIWGDGRLLFADVVGRGAERPITGLDVSGVNELKFCAVAAGPAGTDPYAAEAYFVNPVVSP